ncbi:MAG: leucyl/phenylalanyl-tRNA--protein transferase [Paracoccus sp. (in: a-proteobacteria)]|uniref:leucyl/phenylalanyl-tRNA--protein transferase n=1 Tax=Paracoccus sp. TaxID=267 RepID=UPI0026E07F51|nr:leucyl/phenylalanyl-tRNA--protein transferase [Paracoccus sp. (in: a-proteobacteria)]MDO5614515.1 leucyl/phenylalanyl-tRNA--protein transferase [Paracoccus sp. (in: a-proteobacteria)]
MLTPAHLLNAYAQGVFPMAESADDPRLHWFDPPRRGILPVGGVRAARSLRRDLRRGGWSAHLDGDFDAVVAACADRDETWINAPLRDLYHDLHKLGYAEALTIRQNGSFAGGIFGVILGGAFFGESMVSLRRSGSRMALIWLSSHLARCGFTLFDTQFLTPHLASMGGVEISRADYRSRLAAALQAPADFHAAPLPEAVQLWQEITQTS